MSEEPELFERVLKDVAISDFKYKEETYKKIQGIKIRQIISIIINALVLIIGVCLLFLTYKNYLHMQRLIDALIIGLTEMARDMG